MSAKLAHRVALGAAVRAARKQLGLTMEQLAERADLHWTYVGGIERGERNPSYDALVRLATALDTPLSQLLAAAEKSEPEASGH